MKIKNSDVFTRPMLREYDDDFSSIFKANFDVSTKKNSLVLTYDIELKSSKFSEYCKNKDVLIGIHLYSQNIMFRKFIELDNSQLQGTEILSRDEVFNKIEISPILIANKDLYLSLGDELNDLDDDNFFVKKGMILGYAETCVLDVDYSKSNIDDMVVVHPTDIEEKFHTISIDDKIIYYMETEEYNAFSMLYKSTNLNNKRLAKLIHLSIYTKLLYYVLEVFQEDEDDVFFEGRIYNFIRQQYEMNFPGEKLLRIDSNDISKIAAVLTEISFIEIQSDIIEEGEDE